MSIQNQPRAISLFCREGSSDKVYQASLRESDGGWIVDFAYGKRGTALKSGTKTAAPIGFEQAAKLFDKLVNEKTAKGYTLDQNGVAYTNSEHAKDFSGYLPQLPTPIDPQLLESVLDDSSWCLQEKKDGENRLLVVCNDQIRGVNRRGLFIDIPTSWAALLAGFSDCVIAGEAVGRDFFAFDLLELNGENLKDRPFSARFALLEKALAQLSDEAVIQIVPVVTGAQKRLFLAGILDRNGEGGVFKKLDSPVQVGKCRTQLKHKFIESSTCIVVNHNSQRSVGVGLLDDLGNLVQLGNVTIPENHSIPALESLAEIRYLYRFENGYFEQPCYLGPRNDLDRSDALLSQIGRIKPKSCDEA